MSNMHGYNDYDGPAKVQIEECKEEKTLAEVENDLGDTEDSDDEDCGPLQAGFWMEGDSLAPPCGTTVPTIHELLAFADVTDEDILYDFGCGDGRVCLEAHAIYDCVAVGVEVEADLVERARFLISRISTNSRRPRPRIIERDLREVLEQLVESINDCEDKADIPLPLPTIIVLYLLPESLQELKPRFIELLRRLPPPFRVLCNTWGLPNLEPVKMKDIPEPGGATTTVFLYDNSSLSEE